MLNTFFQTVVAAVDERHGLINKFQGDAVLAVFGAPLPSADAACDALATARALSVPLRRLPLVDFGIGVSAGRVFAGNIGAEHRYEYTVIGDPVNEAARLADKAKDTPGRALCSDDALVRADEAERDAVDTADIGGIAGAVDADPDLRAVGGCLSFVPFRAVLLCATGSRGNGGSYTPISALRTRGGT